MKSIMPLARLAKPFTNLELRGTVKGLLADARDDELERRAHGRVPFFRAALIQTDDSPQQFSAFTRDISAEGIGLLHWVPIEPQRLSVIMTRNDERIVNLVVDIAWCLSCGEGWFISGGKIIQASYHNELE